MIEDKVKDVSITIMTIIVIFILGLIINRVTPLLNIEQIIYIGGVSVLILSIILLLILNKHFTTLKIQVTRIENAMRYVEDLKEEVCYLTTNELIEFEKKMSDNGEVTVFSPEISMDIKEPFYDVIKQNIERGVKYKYVLPDTIVVKSQYNSLKEELKKDEVDIENKLNVIYLPEKIIVHGITLYLDKKEKRGFLNVPHRKFEGKYFILMDNEFYNRTKECINKTIDTLGKPEQG